MLRKLYPSWSPAAIKSALMTTSYTLDNSGRSLIDLYDGQPSVPYAHGSGPYTLIQPTNKIALFLRNSPLVDCTNRDLGNPGSLNYPSFAVAFKNNLQTVTYKRTIKNVWKVKNVAYQVTVVAPSNVRVNVSPTRLHCQDALAEWLRRVPAKYMGFPRESSNLSGVEILFLFVTP
nr:subtilisin-like protease SBT1.4 [Ipomoea batatas]GMC89362.1 subtilisin-like protease SBT1.4 [Ipomoea batatas]